MKCFIKNQFDKREVGTELDLHESIAKRLEQKEFVSFNRIEINKTEEKVKNIKKVKKNEKSIINN